MAKTGTPPDRFSPDWIDRLDGRYAIAGEMRIRFEQFTDDLGGLPNLSYAQRSLIQRALWLEHWLGQEEQRLAAGDNFDVGRWTQGCNALQGIYSKLGLARQPRDVVDIAEYLASR